MTDSGAEYIDKDVIDIKKRAGITRRVEPQRFSYVVYHIGTGKVEQKTWDNDPRNPNTVKSRLGFLEMLNLMNREHAGRFVFIAD